LVPSSIRTALLQKRRLPSLKRIRRFIAETPQAVAPSILALAIALLMLFGQTHEIFNSSALDFLARTGTPVCILGLGVGVVIAMGEIDLSFVGVSNVTSLLILLSFNWLGIENPLSFFSVIVLSTLSATIGGAFGLLNGYLVSRYRAPSLILTWGVGGTLSLMVLGFAFAVKDKHIAFANIEASTQTIQYVLDKPTVEQFETAGIYIGLALLVFVYYTVRSLGLDLYARAIGANSLNAASQGLPVPLIQKMTFAFSGSCAGLAGYYSSVLQTGSISTSSYFVQELIVIAIIVLGGASLRGGYYSALSIVCACTFWALCSYVVMYLPSTSAVGASLMPGALALLLVLVSIFAGRSLAADTYTVHIPGIKKEDDHDD